MRYSEILIENRRFNPPHFCLAPPLRVTPLEFRRDFGTRKLESYKIGLSFLWLCFVILGLAIFVGHRLVTRADKRTTDGQYGIQYNTRPILNEFITRRLVQAKKRNQRRTHDDST